jgi:protein-S-isoprenylcysteine O-methyltransferase Ste14
MPDLVGMLLQGCAAMAITLSMETGPLHPGPAALAGALVLELLAPALFIWALRSAPREANAETLVTNGAYAWLRHPIYAAFFALLVATGLLVSTGIKLVLAVGLYVFGSELRIASEEVDLTERFPETYARYCHATPWRYLPGLR